MIKVTAWRQSCENTCVDPRDSGVCAPSPLAHCRVCVHACVCVCWQWGRQKEGQEATAGRGEGLLHAGTEGQGVMAGAEADAKSQVRRGFLVKELM